MTAALTIHNAEITTATVQVKTLTISGKQVTLAVFRQLIEAQLVSDDGSLAGLPWGTVNYHPGKDCYEGEHLHVVWQLGEELRRSQVRKPDWSRLYWSDETDAFIAGWFCANDHRKPEWVERTYDGTWRFELSGHTCNAAEPRKPFDGGGGQLLEGFREPHVCAPPPDFTVLHAEIAAEDERRGRHRARWAELCDLPQLFIAV